MRYFSYVEYNPDSDGDTVTFSEEEIRKEYYPYWYGKMCEKFGQEHVDKTYNFDDCIDDWIVVHWAWEVKE